MAAIGLAAALALAGVGCGKADAKPDDTIYLAAGGRVKTLDPALADDLASRNMVGAFYDMLLEYDYLARPYQLRPSMLRRMPEVNADNTVFRFTLRDDLYFPADPCFDGLPADARKITAEDVIFSLKRIADGRLHSPSYWMLRGKVAGIEDFRVISGQAAARDFDVYHTQVAGLTPIDELTFEIRLNAPDPRFLAILALPNTAVVSRRAVEFYGESFAEKPVGSGPFRLTRWIRDYRLDLERNADYRRELFPGAASASDRNRPLPLADRIVCYQIRQPFSAWLLFLQGELDISVLDKDNLDLVAGGEKVAPALAGRGVELIKFIEFEIRYIGFNFRDPLLGSNLKLRQAIALAFDVPGRVSHLNNLMIPAAGPIPPGVAGFDAELKNPYQDGDLERARRLLAEAGYPGGIDPATGNPLEFSFDQGNNTAAQRQLGELMQADLARIGIRVTSSLNSTPRFIEKLREGKTQLFRYSWVGDYPDAENFLQLFYRGNIGGCNRTGFADPAFDRMYERAVKMVDSPERTELYRAMVRHLIGQVPWVFEGFPISCQLKYDWLENYHPHDFAFNRWKYFSVRAAERQARKATFRALDFGKLRP
jgi:ABC-type transport system substrate-binding protein